MHGFGLEACKLGHDCAARVLEAGSDALDRRRVRDFHDPVGQRVVEVHETMFDAFEFATERGRVCLSDP